jgi:hypothetical protein
MKGRTGASTGGIFVGKKAAMRDARRRAKEEARWAALSGPLTITFVDPVRLVGQTSEGRVENES